MSIGFRYRNHHLVLMVLGGWILFLICCQTQMVSFAHAQDSNVIIIAEYRFSTGSYPRMCQIGNMLYVAYDTGNISIAAIHLDTNTQDAPISIIPNGARPMLRFDPFSDRLLCVFNSEGSGDGSLIGMASVNCTQIENASAWTIQYNVLGPVPQSIIDAGIWEPYIFPYNSSAGQYFIGYSNQTINNPQNPIDSSNYTFPLDGALVNQKIDLQWLQWNGSAYSVNYIGAISDNINNTGINIHYKDGMVSAVNITQNTNNCTYLDVFESFPTNKPSSIALTCFTLSPTTGLYNEWRTTLTDDSATAPFISTYQGSAVVSYRNNAGSSNECLGLIEIQNNGTIFSNTIHAPQTVASVWPSITTISNGSLFLAGGDKQTNQIMVQQIIPSFNFGQNISGYPIWIFWCLSCIGIGLIIIGFNFRMIKK